MVASNPFQCLTLSLLFIPPLLLTAYLLASFPHPPEALYLHPSLASLPSTSKTWSIYPEDFYPGGAYVTLPYGKVRYWLLGPEKGKKIVLIHGLSIPSIIWKDVAPALASRGYRVLLYDLYGRGYSDAPQTTYNTGLYTMQLALLMQHLRWDKAVIVGVSMGGSIAAAFTASFPHLVDNEVVLIASAGIMETGDISRTAKFMSAPFVQTLAASVPVRTYLQRLANTSIPESAATNPIVELVRLQSAHLPGYNAALSSSLRDGPIRGQGASFSSSGFANKRVLLIHGTEDTTVPPKYSPRIISLLPSGVKQKAKLVSVQGAGHDVTVSHADTVIDALVNFVENKKQ